MVSLLEAARHINRIDKITDVMFIQPVVITLKKDQKVKVALDASSLNFAVLKKTLSMPNLQSLMEMSTRTMEVRYYSSHWICYTDMARLVYILMAGIQVIGRRNLANWW